MNYRQTGEHILAHSYHRIMTNSNTISIDYSEEKLRILVEEYIIQQRGSFTLKDICSYVLYWAMEDGHTTNAGLFEGSQLAQSDCERISSILAKIVGEGRIAVAGRDSYSKL